MAYNNMLFNLMTHNNGKSMKPNLSKSQFIRALQCHKSLWLYKNRPELRTKPDESQQAVSDAGRSVGLLAQGLFPGGETIEFEGSSFKEKIDRTRRLIEGGSTTIYEATFRFDGILVMVDILHKGAKGWELYEVKMSSEVKDFYLNDVAVQYYVLSGSGLPLEKVSLVHIDTDYVRQGDIDIQSLFHIEDLTEKALDLQPCVKDELSGIALMLSEKCPPIDIGPQCAKPYPCDFKEHCWAHIPENSVFDLREKGINKFLYYQNGRLRFEDIDLDELNFKQRMQVDAELNGAEVLNRDGIKEFLDTLYYPIYFLDFETLYNEPIPPFDGTRPYSKIPFQYSLHVLEKEGGELQHYEYLAEGGRDGREDIAKDLVRLIPEDACTLAYNMTFEKGVNAELAEQFPECSERLLNINENMKDLMVPFRRRDYYKKEMKGSYSIKYVLPALIPELTYEGMAVANGDAAVTAYKKLDLIDDPAEVKRIKKDLLTYCELDTLAMVKLLEKLREVV